MDKTTSKVIKFIHQHKLLEGVEHIVVGVSGGADSLCLLHMLKALQHIYEYELTSIHIHHGLRGEEADQDAAFVASFCHNLGIHHQVIHGDVKKIAKEKKMTDEEAGRFLRYETFQQACGVNEKSVIAIAHHLDDQVETVTHHFIRGTGLKGLGGIRPKRNNIIRPLLEITRQEIEAYLHAQGLDYCEDATNKELIYTRNKLRNDLIPKIKAEYNVNFASNIKQMVELFREEESFLEELTRDKMKSCVKQEGSSTVLDIRIFDTYHTAIKRRVLRKILEQFYAGLKDIAFKHVSDLLDLIQGETGKQLSMPDNLVVKKSYDKLSFKSCHELDKCREQQQDVRMNMEIKDFPMVYNHGQGGGRIVFDCLPVECVSEKSKKNYTKCLDYDKIKYTLTLRTRKPGDFICLKGVSGKKKLKDFFIDNKVPREKRDQILLLADDKEVIWIQGMRVNERYYMTDDTSNVLTITIERSKDL